MKQTKEYPATHSMATSWFAIDDEGNVALLNFEDNGPVPCPPASLEQSPESLIEDEGDEQYGFKLLNYTDEQVAKMFRDAPEGFDELYDPEDEYFFDYVQVDSSRTDEFLGILEPIIKSDECGLVCFNKNVGIYNLPGVKRNKDVFEKLKASGCIVKVLKMFVDYEFIRDNETAERLTPIPFYVYNQDYGHPFGDLEKVYTPTMPPFTEEQLSEFMRKAALRINGKFSETQHIQPSSDRPFMSYQHLERRIIDGQVYYRMRLTGNSDEEAYVYDSLLSCEKIDDEYCKGCPIFDASSWRLCSMFLRGDELTNHPTVGLIIDGDRQLEYSVRYNDPDWVYKSFITSAIQCEGAYEKYTSLGNAYKLCQQVGDVPAFNYCKVYFEKILSIFKPYVLVLSETSLHLLLSVYEHDESHVVIAGERYPFFALNEAKVHKDDILHYANKPYRGKVIPKTLSVEEAERIGLRND